MSDRLQSPCSVVSTVITLSVVSLVWLAPGDSRSLGQEKHPQTFAEFEADWRGSAESPVSLSFILDAPAGKRGFIEVRDGHTVYPDGRRFRMWGGNLGLDAICPPKESAPLIAAHLARLGVNCVRFHFLDCTDRPQQTSLIDLTRSDTRHLDMAALDRMDFFFAELKKRGIYVWLELTGGRIYKPGDGVADCELLVYTTPILFFDARVRELQREFIRQLMSHQNPYTGLEYRHEPGLAVIELANETSLVGEWLSDRLAGLNTTKNPGSVMWADLPPRYAEDLTERYNMWLAQRLTPGELNDLRQLAKVAPDAAIPRLRQRDFASAPRRQFHLEAEFYMSLEQDYFLETKRFLQEDLGSRSLVSGSSDHNHGITGYPLVRSTAQLDLVDGHVYWTSEDPMVSNPLRSTVVQLSRSPVLGKPFTVSEVNHMTVTYECEAIPVLAAYAGLQDWDGVFWWSLAHEDPVHPQGKWLGPGNMARDPVKMAQLASGACLFLRGDVAPATRTINRSYSLEQVYESCRLDRPLRPFFTPGFPLSLPLTHVVRVESFAAAETSAFSHRLANPIASDTAELAWHHGGREKGLVTINTPRSQAVVGFVQSQDWGLDHLSGEIQTPFCAIALHALDDAPISRCAKMLLTTGARVAGPVQRRPSELQSASIGIEVVRGVLSLRGLEGATRVTVQALDGSGHPVGDLIVAAADSQSWRFPVGTPASTWYVIDVRRSGTGGE